ncbi:putative uncharacterized protein [Pseudomonas sp. StFLB209]|nr:hypothetical protein [Pseudomonas sp. LJDD11]BAP46032.1 putative uncharacterized protein [Pseudomonas sp. StFLB209]
MKKAFAIVGLSLVFMPTAPAAAATIQIQNQSSWDIHEIYFAPSSQGDWGDDHLGKQVLKAGMTLSVSNVEAGLWDVRLVDEDEDECVIQRQQISTSQAFVIDDEDLLNCQADSDQ